MIKTFGLLIKVCAGGWGGREKEGRERGTETESKHAHSGLLHINLTS